MLSCQLVEKEFGREYRLIQTRMVTQSVRGACADVRTCRLDPKENVELAFHGELIIIKDFIGDSYDENNLHAVFQDSGEETALKPRLTLFGCDAGMKSYTISWDGQLLGCQMLGNFAQNAVKKGFQKAWEDFPGTVKLPELNETCQKCENQKLSNSCCASRYCRNRRPWRMSGICMSDTAVINRLLRRNER